VRDLVAGRQPFVDVRPFAADRFGDRDAEQPVVRTEANII
jgi:hypothetical protein